MLTTFAALAYVLLLLPPTGSLVYFGESINSLAGQHWQAFATQNYFDRHGTFYSTIVAGPAVVTLIAVLVRE